MIDEYEKLKAEAEARFVTNDFNKLIFDEIDNFKKLSDRCAVQIYQNIKKQYDLWDSEKEFTQTHISMGFQNGLINGLNIYAEVFDNGGQEAIKYFVAKIYTLEFTESVKGIAQHILEDMTSRISSGKFDEESKKLLIYLISEGYVQGMVEVLENYDEVIKVLFK